MIEERDLPGGLHMKGNLSPGGLVVVTRSDGGFESYGRVVSVTAGGQVGIIPWEIGHHFVIDQDWMILGEGDTPPNA